MIIFKRRFLHYTKLNQRKQEIGMVQFYFFLGLAKFLKYRSRFIFSEKDGQFLKIYNLV